MRLVELDGKIPKHALSVLEKEGILELRPSQEKALAAGLLDHQNLLVCTPTASGKTLIAELAASKTILEEHKKAVYIVPLVALANDKYKDFKRKYNALYRIALSIGDLDAADPRLSEYDLIICTAEKLDSLLRHQASWLLSVGLVVVDEIHLLNDPGRGPVLEILLTLLKQVIPRAQIIGLSATIGNPEELAAWLQAKLVQDTWRPVPLHKGVYLDGTVEFDTDHDVKNK